MCADQTPEEYERRHAYKDALKKEATAKAKELYAHLDRVIGEAAAAAQKNGQKLVIAVGEHHLSDWSFLAELMTQHVAHKHGVTLQYMEQPHGNHFTEAPGILQQQRLDERGQPMEGWESNLYHTWHLLRHEGMASYGIRTQMIDNGRDGVLEKKRIKKWDKKFNFERALDPEGENMMRDLEDRDHTLCQTIRQGLPMERGPGAIEIMGAAHLYGLHQQLGREPGIRLLMLNASGNNTFRELNAQELRALPKDKQYSYHAHRFITSQAVEQLPTCTSADPLGVMDMLDICSDVTNTRTAVERRHVVLTDRARAIYPLMKDVKLAYKAINGQGPRAQALDHYFNVLQELAQEPEWMMHSGNALEALEKVKALHAGEQNFSTGHQIVLESLGKKITPERRHISRVSALTAEAEKELQRLYQQNNASTAVDPIQNARISLVDDYMRTLEMVESCIRCQTDDKAVSLIDKALDKLKDIERINPEWKERIREHATKLGTLRSELHVEPPLLRSQSLNVQPGQQPTATQNGLPLIPPSVQPVRC